MKRKNKCVLCGKEFHLKKYTSFQKYCSKKCQCRGWYKSDAGKETEKRYRQSDKYKETKKKYSKTKTYKDYQMKRKKSKTYKDYMKKYMKRYMKKYMKTYKHSDAFKKAQKKYKQKHKKGISECNGLQKLMGIDPKDCYSGSINQTCMQERFEWDSKNISAYGFHCVWGGAGYWAFVGMSAIPFIILPAFIMMCTIVYDSYKKKKQSKNADDIVLLSSSDYNAVRKK
jgi:endogenous inhibitor of DNA gyrase (YacG/DUF329 family)